MGSDSRTATATSSKPRPSWRDRHLKQLNEDQLHEVSEHRGAPVAEIAGIKSTQASEAPASGAQQRVEDSLPKRQAGPDRARRSKTSDRHRASDDQFDDTRKLSRNRAKDNDDVLQRHSEYQQSRHAEQEQRGERARHSVRRDNDPRSERRPQRQTENNRRQERRELDRPRQEQSAERAPQQDRRPRLDQERRHERRPQRSAPGNQNRRAAEVSSDNRHAQQSAEKASKKGLFTKLANFKIEGPLKYGLMALAMAVMVAVSFMKPIDDSSKSQLDSALTRAAIGFGIARTLNGVISVAQGTEFAVQPAGVGVNFSPGEILDPINDLVERFSLVMLLATSSLGVQKILLDVSSWAGVSMLLAGAALFFLLTRIRNSGVSRMADVAGKILLLMLLVRFLIPLGSLANDWVYKQFLEPRFEQSSAQLEIASERIREISTRQAAAKKPAESLKDRAKNLYSSMTEKFDFDGMLNDYKNSAENVSEHAVNLIVVFLLQTIIFPLIFLYLIYRLFRSVILPSRRTA